MYAKQQSCGGFVLKLPVNYNHLTSSKRREVRDFYYLLQEGKCYHCKAPLDRLPEAPQSVDASLFPKGFFNNPVHLHHSHKTGLTIGAVHAHCNAVLWQYHGE